MDGPLGLNGQAGQQARFTHLATGGTATLVIRSTEHLERFLGRYFPATGASILHRGGVLAFVDLEGDQRFTVCANGGERQKTTPPLPALRVHVPRAISSRFSGAILIDAAISLGLPVSPPVQYVYTPVSPATVSQAEVAAVRSRYDSEFIHYAVSLPRPSSPPRPMSSSQDSPSAVLLCSS